MMSNVCNRCVYYSHNRAITTIRLERHTDGAPPAITAYIGKNTINNHVAFSLVSILVLTKTIYIIDVMSPTCNPDMASIWDNPHSLNNSTRSSSNKSVEPINKACSQLVVVSLN